MDYVTRTYNHLETLLSTLFAMMKAFFVAGKWPVKPVLTVLTLSVIEATIVLLIIRRILRTRRKLASMNYLENRHKLVGFRFSYFRVLSLTCGPRYRDGRCS